MSVWPGAILILPDRIRTLHSASRGHGPFSFCALRENRGGRGGGQNQYGFILCTGGDKVDTCKCTLFHQQN